MSRLAQPNEVSIALIADLVRDHGLSSIDPKQCDCLQAMIGGDIKITLLFTDDVCVIQGVVSETSEVLKANSWIAFDSPVEWADRRTRLAVEPESKHTLLVRDIFLQGVTYSDFSKALDVFISDIQEARAMVGQKKSKTSSSDADNDKMSFGQASDDSVIIR